MIFITLKIYNANNYMIIVLAFELIYIINIINMAIFINYIFIFISKITAKQIGHLNSLLDPFSNKYFLIQLK